jgi:hypothetical protein
MILLLKPSATCGAKELVIIADNLDRIGLIPRENGKTNHDEIFIDHSSQMCRLAAM